MEKRPVSCKRLLIAAEQMLRTIVKENEADQVQRTKVKLGEFILCVPRCAVDAFQSLRKTSTMCNRKHWDMFVSHLRDMRLWPSIDMYALKYTSDLDWNAIAENADFHDRLERSIWMVAACSSIFIQLDTPSVSVLQRLFGYHLDRNPSLNTARLYFGSSLTETEHYFLHVAMVAVFMADATVVHAGGSVSLLKGKVEFADGSVTPLLEFEY